MSREADLIEEVARLADLDTELPSTLPATPRAGRPPERASSCCAAAPRTRCAGWAPTRSSAGASPTPASPTGCGSPDGDPRRELVELANPLSASSRCCGRRCSASLLDAAKLNLARGAERVALFESGARLPAPAPDGAEPSGELGGGFSGEHPAPAYEPHRLGYLAAGEPRAELARRAPARPTSSRPRASSSRSRPSSAPRLEVEAAEQPFLHPGRSARVCLDRASEARPPAGSASCIPLVAREWDLDGRRGLRGRPRRR